MNRDGESRACRERTKPKVIQLTISIVRFMLVYWEGLVVLCYEYCRIVERANSSNKQTRSGPSSRTHEEKRVSFRGVHGVWGVWGGVVLGWWCVCGGGGFGFGVGLSHVATHRPT